MGRESSLGTTVINQEPFVEIIYYGLYDLANSQVLELDDGVLWDGH